MNIRFEKIAAQIERDVAQTARNQVTSDKLKRLTPRGKLMVLALRRPLVTALVLNVLIWIFLALGAVVAFADEQHVQCPDPGVKCKIIYLSEQEERMLMTQNGILDTAAQARSLDLGQFAVYLKTRIGSAPQGEVKPVENKPAAPVDKK